MPQDSEKRRFRNSMSVSWLRHALMLQILELRLGTLVTQSGIAREWV